MNYYYIYELLLLLFDNNNIVSYNDLNQTLTFSLI